MKDIMPLLEKLAASLGVGVDKLWAALLAQAQLAANYHHSFMVFWTCAAIAMGLIAIVCFIAQKQDCKGDHIWFGTGITFVIAAGLLFIFRLIEHYEYITAKCNAEYYACRAILDALKKQ